MNSSNNPFARSVADGMRRQGLTLRSFCRAVDLDPSFFSKVLAGKRSPPSSEDVLRRIARLLSLGEAELIVSAGRIPAEWSALSENPRLFRDVNAMAAAAALSPAPSRNALAPVGLASVSPKFFYKRHKKDDLAEELL